MLRGIPPASQPCWSLSGGGKTQDGLDFINETHVGNKKEEGWVHEHLEDEEEQAAAKTWGFPAVGKRQGAPAPAASSPHAPEQVPSQGRRKARSAWYALHIPALSKAGARRLALCERGGCKKAISCHCHGNRPGCARSKLVPSVRS